MGDPKKGYIKDDFMTAYLGEKFICGESESKHSDGMSKELIVCPEHGVDWTVIYFHGSTVRALEQRVQDLECEVLDLKEYKWKYEGLG